MARNNWRLVFALSLVAAAAAAAGPAGAQFPVGHAALAPHRGLELVQFHDFFRSWEQPPPNNSYDPFNPFTRQQRPQVYESLKPPSPTPRKADAPAPTETVVVIGDSLADWLGYGLELTFADTPEFAIVRKIKPYSGLVRYDTRADSPDWSQAIKEVLATEKANAIVIMLGINDRLPLRDRAPPAKTATPSPAGAPGAPGATPPSGSSAAPAETTQPDTEQQPSTAANEAQRRLPTGATYEFHTDKWAELYARRIDEMIAALKSKGVPILWVGVPAVRGVKSTTDMSYLDDLYRARADKAGITYVDIWDGFVDDQGRYAVQGPDFEGQTRRLRTYDGVNFTKAGAEKLAHYVEHDLRRVLTGRVVPVALPGPEEPAKRGAIGGAHPAVIGPVVPLGAITAGERGDLMGAANHPAPQGEGDPLATRVLIRGDAIAAPSGRADDFAWPRTNAAGEADIAPTPGTAAPVAAPAKGSTAKNDANKNDASKNNASKNNAGKSDVKKSTDARTLPAQAVAPPLAPHVAPPKPRRPGDQLDGAPPRPPLPVGPANGR